MSHELTIRANKQVEFAYRASEGPAWHGLGNPMQDNATIDEWKASAGMDWKIQRSKVRYAVSRGPSQVRAGNRDRRTANQRTRAR